MTVSIIHCRTYDRDQTQAAVHRAVDLLGGAASFISPGNRVLIKPNLLKPRPSEAAVTTHPEVVRAVIRLVREAGGTALVGDSPGMGDLEQAARKSGIYDAVREEGAQLVSFEDAVPVKNTGRFQRFEVARPAHEADVLINLPKLKTHGMTTLTGAVKNLFGCVPGRKKVQWHFNTGVNHEAFMIMLLELSRLLKPRLTIMDAIVGMEGNGPGSGDPRTIGAVIAGTDPIAVDAVAGMIVGVPPDRHPIVRTAMKTRIADDLSSPATVGDPIGGLRVRNFRLPPREHPEWPIPEWLRKTLKEALTTKPVINHPKCIGCGICGKHCPQGAIRSGRSGLVINYRTCIRCFCCQEFCPQGAITVGKGWALRVVG